MPKPKRPRASTSFKVGDRVKIRHYAGMIGKIVEARGEIGPGGQPVFRVLVARRPSPSYIELRGDQLVPVASIAEIKDLTLKEGPKKTRRTKASAQEGLKSAVKAGESG